jgi:hypothetical protein
MFCKLLAALGGSFHRANHFMSEERFFKIVHNESLTDLLSKIKARLLFEEM